jgi:serine/threonine protein kinase
MIGIDDHSFHEEVMNMKTIYKIFKQDTEKLTTLTSLNLYGFNFIAAYIVFHDNTHIYTTFTKRCDSDLEHTKMNNHLFKKLMRDLLIVLDRMQSNNFIHCDIKPDNIIYCKKNKKFKLIDWGMATYIDINKRLYGNIHCNMPLSAYIFGYPQAVASRLIYYANWKKNKEYFESPIFQEVYKVITSDFAEVMKRQLTRLQLLELYGKKQDIFALGMTLAYLVAVHKLDWKKHKTFIMQLISLESCLDAHEALNSHRSLYGRV